MQKTSSQATFAPSDQAAQVISFSPQHSDKVPVEPFRDNQDYLQALEQEARLLLARALLRRTGKEWQSKTDYIQALSFLGLDPEGVSLDNLDQLLSLNARRNRAREEVSLRSGMDLMFCLLCRDYRLGEFDRTVVLLLFMLKTSQSFLEMVLLCGFERDQFEDDGMKIGPLLFILCKDYGEQLERRAAFSIEAPLMRQDILVIKGDVDEESNILDERVQLSGRFERYILRDNNLYSSAFRFIRREAGQVPLEQVIMAEEIKNEVVMHVGSFFKQHEKVRGTELDEFFGYGTALTLLFYGPSGTGKTMLAQGLACNFQRPLYSLKVEDMSRISRSDDDILATLFREASLRGGIVFLDESDDLFERDSRLSRSLLIEIEKARCVIILATNRPVELDPAMERRIAMKIPFALPDKPLRHKIWQALLPDGVKLATGVDLEVLAERFPFTGGLIKNTIFLAANRALGLGNGASPVITMAMLEHAADHQAISLADGAGLSRSYTPSHIIENLPLRKRQKEELGNTAKAFYRLRQEGLGINILVCCLDVKTGIHAVEAIAADCKLRVREFDCVRIMSGSEDDKMIHPLTHKRVKPIRYALSSGTGDASLTLFVDHEGSAAKMLEQGGSVKSLLFEEFVSHLREHRGFFCLVTKRMKPGWLPLEFHLRFDLDCPAEEEQMRCWEKHLGKGQIREEQLVLLVEEHPMHVAEIDFIARQATIQAIIQGRDGGPTLADFRQVIARYRRKRVAPVLFGTKRDA